MKYTLKAGTESLNIQELTQFNEFLLKSIYFGRKRKITPLYRGDKLENLYQRLGLHYQKDNNNYEELLKRLFMIGEKSRNFYSDNFFELSSTRSLTINDSNENVFVNIFDNINSSIKSKNTDTISFFNANDGLKQFFINKATNKKAFIEKALGLNATERIHLRNYYWTLLHQLGSINYKNATHFVSTSASFNIAKDFAGDAIAGKRVILHCWKPINRFNKFKEFGFPVNSSPPYKNQKEISFLAGILPHYIIGLQVVEDELFFINPNIFSNTLDENVFIDGLVINQDEFPTVLKQTNYGKSFEANGISIKERLY